VHSVIFTNQIKAMLIIYKYERRNYGMFQYKCTIFRENKITGLKPADSARLLFTGFSSL